MAGGFPLLINDIFVPSAEALYQACRFPHLPNIQKLIIEQNSPMTAKMVSRPYRNETRPDWMKIRVNVMRWVLRVKLVLHWSKFGGLLLATGNLPIVEDSRNDDFWGALRSDNETFVGMNVLGRLLMELREEIKNSSVEAMRIVTPPVIPDFKLLEQLINKIYLDEKLENIAVEPDILFKQGTLWNSSLEETENVDGKDSI